MRFAHSQEHLDLRDGAREYLRERCTADQLRAWANGEKAEALEWSELVEMGLPGFLAPESQGGLGMDASGFALLAEEAGYVALPEPLVDVAGVSAPLLAAIPGQEASVAALCDGALRVQVAHPLNLGLNRVQASDKLLLLGEDIILVDAQRIELESAESIDPLRHLSRLAGAPGEGECLASGETARALTRDAALRGAVFGAAELLGLGLAMLDRSRDYACERKQFGRAIGSYQSIKHHLANAFVRLEFARPVVYRAAAGLDSEQAGITVAQARVAAIEAVTEVAEIAIQVHGAMGYTFEVDLHLWMKRAWALSGCWGDRNHHLAILEAALLDGRLKAGPSQTFGCS
jgi:alkylation response protein AidB-like acyl-CoA dehydrogenase